MNNIHEKLLIKQKELPKKYCLKNIINIKAP